MNGKELPRDSPYSTFTAVRRGEVSQAEMRSVYRENVAHVLESVASLREQIDGKIVVTADHGELLGEGVPLHTALLHPRWPVWRRSWFDYAHYSHVRPSTLIDVPWFVPAYDERRRVVSADQPEPAEVDESALNEQLAALGYK